MYPYIEYNLKSTRIKLLKSNYKMVASIYLKAHKKCKVQIR